MPKERNEHQRENAKKKAPARHHDRTVPAKFNWKVLEALLKDAPKEVIEHVPDLVKKLRGLVRNRDVVGYLDFCDSVSLKTVNDQLVELYQENPLSHLIVIRTLRLWTLFQKFDFPDSPINKLDAAKAKFFRAEALCARVNRDPIWKRFESSEDDGSEPTLDCIFTYKVLQYAKRFIGQTLGDCDIDNVLAESTHGPGASADKRGQLSIPIEKFVAPLAGTRGALKHFKSYLVKDPRWLRSLVQHYKHQCYANSSECTSVRKFSTDSLEEQQRFLNWAFKHLLHSRVLFVPKDARTLRTICAEPTVNVFLQLGVGRYIMKRLRRRGIDLLTQLKNQLLALRASLLDDLVTIDLKSASDLIALKLLALFPRPWADLLMDLRVPRGCLADGEEIVFEKLSAMGNGFTFCIESLVFTSLLYGVVRSRGEDWKTVLSNIAVYGDDIICPKRFYSDYVYILARCGFETNTSKTFVRGKVRESCGADFYDGEDISRPTIKERPTAEWEVVAIRNRLFLWSQRNKINLKNTLGLLEDWIKKKNYGPICEDVCCWIFSIDPVGLPVYNCREAFDWHTPVWKLRQTTLGHPKRKPKCIQALYEPLMYLRQEYPVPWWESGDFLPPSSVNAYSFVKIKRSVAVTVKYLPIYLWQNQPLSVFRPGS